MLQDKDGVWRPLSKIKSNNVKGNFGETMADLDAESKGWKKLNGPNAQIGDKIEKGIDGVYENTKPPPPYIVADAKYGSAKLSTLKDGTKQMSPKWIEDRLRDAVGRERAEEIIDAGYGRVVQRVDGDGNVTIENLDGLSWR